MILRRGRSAQPVGLGLDIELTYERSRMRGRRADLLESWRPPTEVFECGDGLVAVVEIAGHFFDDLDVVVNGDELRVRRERTAGYPTGPRLYHEPRIRYGPFEAAAPLPFPVDVSDASAEYVDGLLTVRLPRRVATKVPMRDDSHG